jgi:phosphate transport system substrate-binding protein
MKMMIGIVGVNWLSQPNQLCKKYVVRCYFIKSEKLNEDNFCLLKQYSRKKYPLARDLYIINCQGFSGLGNGI